ncbi:MAG: TIGR02996 domain-containing protein [Kofleriaceae bacterium]
MRRFEHPNGRFWQIEVQFDGQLLVQWGQKPEPGQRRNLPADKGKMNELIAKQLALGYVEVAVAPRATEPVDDEDDDEPVEAKKKKISTARCVDEPALEAECRAAPNDPEPWIVYADWLMQQGDPRGEIAALIRTDTAGSHALLAEHHELLFGEGETRVDITGWRHGFASSVTIKTEYDGPESLIQMTKEFLDHPISAFVDEFRFGLSSFEGENDWGPVLDEIVEWAHADHVRAMRFDDFTQDEQEISWVNPGNLSKLWQLPNLREVVIHGSDCTLGAIEAPRLSTFIRKSGGLSEQQVMEIVDAKWPALQHLEIWFGQQNYGAGGDAEMIAPILRGTNLPKLKHLGIVNCEFSLGALEILLAGKLLPRLRSLDLSSGIMWTREFDLLIANVDKLRHLESIDITDNYLSGDQVHALVRALPAIVSNDQRDSGDAPMEDEDPDEEWRYAALGE